MRALNNWLLKLFDQKLSLYFVFLFALVSFNYWPKWVEDLSYNLVDTQVRLIHRLGLATPPNDDVIVVEIDDKSIDEFGRWPWSREKIGELITQLSGASLVVADMVFSERATEAEDWALADAISEADNVILGFFLRGTEEKKPDYRGYKEVEKCALQNVKTRSSLNYVGLPSIKGAEVNIPEIAEASLSCALFSVESEYDGLYRQYPLAYVYQDLVVPTLAVQAYQFHTNKEFQVTLDEEGIERLEGKDLLIQNKNKLLINFPSEQEVLSAVEVLSSNFDKTKIENKIVLVGLSEIGLFDLRPTPLNQYTPGVHVHASALSNLLNHNWYETIPGIGWSTSLVFILFIIQISKFVGKAIKRWGIYTLLFSSYFVISFYLMWHHSHLIDAFKVLTYSIITVMIVEGMKFVDVQKEYKSVRTAFSSYVVPELVEKIVEQGVNNEQKGVLKPVAIMFTDIRDFTHLSEDIAPEQVINLLNTVFEPVTRCISDHEGMLDKYIGDEVMAIFNAPMDVEEFAEKAIQASISVQKTLVDVNHALAEQSLPTVALSIGVSSGPVILGHVGSHVRISYTAIGNTVNLASRITSLCKLYNQQVLIDGELYNQLSAESKKHFSFIDNIIVKGRSESVTIFGIEDVNFAANDYLELAYIRAYELYKNGQFSQAKQAFSDLIKQYNHGASKLMLTRSERLANADISNWDGVYKFDHK